MRPPLSLSRSSHQKDNVNQELKKGSWDEEEDRKLMDHISKQGPGNWQSLPERAGLNRCGKSCRLRWINYLRPGIKKGNFTPEEDQKIIKLHSEVGNKWSFIATYLEGRTDNEIKNYWNTKLSRRLFNSGIDPTIHQPIPTVLARLLHNHSSRVIIYNNPILPLDNNLYSSTWPVHEYIHTHGALQLIDNALTQLNPTFYGGPESNFLGPSYGFDPLHHDLNALSNSQASSSINRVDQYVGSNSETLLFYDGYQENDGMINMGSTSTAPTPNMSSEHNWQLPGLVNLSMPVQVSFDHAFSNDNNQEFLSGHTTDFFDAADAMNYDDMWETEIGDDEATTGSFFLNDNVSYASLP